MEHEKRNSKRLGLIVNPIAGMGGPVAMKGTDGADAASRAIALGAQPVTGARAVRFLVRLAAAGRMPELLAVPGAMGGDAAREAAVPIHLLPIAIGERTSAEDTRCAARAMAEAGAGLVVFVGIVLHYAFTPPVVAG